jgi:hypothetical protein
LKKVISAIRHMSTAVHRGTGLHMIGKFDGGSSADAPPSRAGALRYLNQANQLTRPADVYRRMSVDSRSRLDTRVKLRRKMLSATRDTVVHGDLWIPVHADASHFRGRNARSREDCWS